ncbi:MAG: methyltransferase domain-containing protein [Chloroflexi bacterium]|nr:methyltransferase domain-containing protein [Chloroflexota bacterium]
MSSLVRHLRPWYRFFRGLPGRMTLAQRARVRPCRIVVGASGFFDPGWIPTEVSYLDLLKPGDWARYFPDNWIDAILAEHVWEHLTAEEGARAAGICYRYLRGGGYLRVAVPDGNHPVASYIDWVRPGGTSAAAKDHKVLYTYQSFERLFRTAGFSVILLEYFDERGEFHFRDWDPAAGYIHRSSRYDKRNRGGALKYTSIILDAVKPAAPQGS